MYTTYVEHDAAGALPDLNRALELAPSDADSHSIAGLTTRRLGRFDEAIGHFREAARLKPGDNKYVWRALETLDGLGRFEETERELENLERRYPNPYWELVRFRQRFHRFGETDGWRDAYERIASKLSPQYRPFPARTCLLATGDLEGWIAYVEQLGPKASSLIMIATRSSESPTGPPASRRARVLTCSPSSRRWSVRPRERRC